MEIEADRDEADAVVQWRIVLLDVTERWKAAEALEKSEAHLKAIVDNTPDIIFMKNLEGRYLLINKKCEEVLGLNSAFWIKL